MILPLSLKQGEELIRALSSFSAPNWNKWGREDTVIQKACPIPHASLKCFCLPAKKTCGISSVLKYSSSVTGNHESISEAGGAMWLHNRKQSRQLCALFSVNRFMLEVPGSYSLLPELCLMLSKGWSSCPRKQILRTSARFLPRVSWHSGRWSHIPPSPDCALRRYNVSFWWQLE